MLKPFLIYFHNKILLLKLLIYQLMLLLKQYKNIYIHIYYYLLHYSVFVKIIHNTWIKNIIMYVK